MKHKSVMTFTAMTMAVALMTAVVPSAFAEGQGSVKASQSTAALQTRIDEVIASAQTKGITVGATFQDLNGVYGGGSLSAGAHGQAFKAASTIKLGITSYLMHGVDQGKWSLDTPITVESSDVVGGAGTIQSDVAALPKDFTLSELMRLMITVSDNTATNRLIDFAGGFDNINAYTQSVGLVDSGFHLGRKMILPHTAEEENWISSDEDAKLLTLIYRASTDTSGGIISQESAKQVITWMRQQTVNTKFGAVIPREVLANKTGENTDVSHDTGYVLVPGREVALSVMTSFDPSQFTDWTTAFNTANEQVQAVAKVVYQYLLEDHPVATSGEPANTPTSTVTTPGETAGAASDHASTASGGVEQSQSTKAASTAKTLADTGASEDLIPVLVVILAVTGACCIFAKAAGRRIVEPHSESGM